MDVFAAIADPVRRRLLRRVTPVPVRAGDLAAEHEVSRPAVSRHLRVLANAGLVDVELRGRERYYRMRPAGLQPLRDLIEQLTPDSAYPSADPRARPTPEQLLALDTEVRRTARDRTARDDTDPAKESA